MENTKDDFLIKVKKPEAKSWKHKNTRTKRRLVHLRIKHVQPLSCMQYHLMLNASSYFPRKMTFPINSTRATQCCNINQILLMAGFCISLFDIL